MFLTALIRSLHNSYVLTRFAPPECDSPTCSKLGL